MIRKSIRWTQTRSATQHFLYISFTEYVQQNYIYFKPLISKSNEIYSHLKYFILS